MTSKILIIGGYGAVGQRVALALAQAGIPVIIAGRSHEKAAALAALLPAGFSEPAAFDARVGLSEALVALRPAVVVDAAGLGADAVPATLEACFHAGAHYVGLAGDRPGIACFAGQDEAARSANVTAIGGAGVFPAFSSAVVEHFKPLFSKIESLECGVSPGQKAGTGLATARTTLAQAGVRTLPFADRRRGMTGWQQLHRVYYPELGRRWMANYDAADLDLYPAIYGVEHMRLAVGLELSVLHLGLWAMSWAVRAGLPLKLEEDAASLLDISRKCDRFGSANSGMHLFLKGRDHQGKPLAKRWFLIARRGDGMQVAAAPAIVFAKKLVRNEGLARGAYHAAGRITLAECMEELRDFAVEQA